MVASLAELRMTLVVYVSLSPFTATKPEKVLLGRSGMSPAQTVIGDRIE
jgi:hypothetical protein